MIAHQRMRSMSDANGDSTHAQCIEGLIPELAVHPRVALVQAPTPLDHAPRLGHALGIDLYIKRDDCTGLAAGGNKVRQLEYYMGQAQATNADVVLITGAVQSNFVRLCAAAAARLGMEAQVQLEHRVAGMDRNYHECGNVLLDRLLAARIQHLPMGVDEAGADAQLEHRAALLAASGRRPYVIHLGVEHPPVGALGYMRCAAELVAQLRHQRLAFDALVTPSGSGLTHVGLLAGMRALDQRLPIHGVCVRRAAAAQRARIIRRLRESIQLSGIAVAIDDAEVSVTDASLAPGYGQLNDRTWQAMRAAGRLEGLLLDPVYSGKTMAGLVDLVEQGTIRKGARVLFIHSGGWPALFGYQAALQPYLNAHEADSLAPWGARA